MKQVAAILAMGILTVAAAPPKTAETSSSAKAKCGYTIQRANAAAGKSTPEANDVKPALIRAVDKRLAGCPVLVLADGKFKAPPAFTDGPATAMPASKSPAQ